MILAKKFSLAIVTLSLSLSTINPAFADSNIGNETNIIQELDKMDYDLQIAKLNDELSALQAFKTETNKLLAASYRARNEYNKFEGQYNLYTVSMNVESVAIVMTFAAVSYKINAIRNNKDKRYQEFLTKQEFLAKTLNYKPKGMDKFFFDLGKTLEKNSGKILIASTLITVLSEYAREYAGTEELKLNEEQITLLESKLKQIGYQINIQENLINTLKRRAEIRKAQN